MKEGKNGTKKIHDRELNYIVTRLIFAGTISVSEKE